MIMMIMKTGVLAVSICPAPVQPLPLFHPRISFENIIFHFDFPIFSDCLGNYLLWLSLVHLGPILAWYSSAQGCLMHHASLPLCLKVGSLKCRLALKLANSSHLTQFTLNTSEILWLNIVSNIH